MATSLAQLAADYKVCTTCGNLFETGALRGALAPSACWTCRARARTRANQARAAWQAAAEDAARVG